MVKQCTKMKGIKRLFLRNHLRTKIRHYDGELSNALQAFQVGTSFLLFDSFTRRFFLQAVLSLDIRFALLTEKREVWHNNIQVRCFWLTLNRSLCLPAELKQRRQSLYFTCRVSRANIASQDHSWGAKCFTTIFWDEESFG